MTDSKKKKKLQPKGDSLGDRMKGYENAFKASLPRRMPVVVRVDGKAFHTYTKGCDRPWDDKLTHVMDETAIALCKNVQGVQMAYVQSDEISLLLHNYKKLESQAWFDNEIQKIVSVSAGIASATFTMKSDIIFAKECKECGFLEPGQYCYACNDSGFESREQRLAVFDSRVFLLPEAEVCNYYIWRQQDATRNSVQMLARSLYSHKELHGKNNPQLQDLCQQKGKNWNNVPVYQKRGRCIVKNDQGEWTVDKDIPIFSQDREYVNKFLAVDPEDV